MTDLYTIDFETYYDKEYSLRRMSMEEYICHEHFECMLVGIKKNDQPATWHSHATLDGYKKLFQGLGLENSAILCHNTMFDGLILKQYFSITPKVYLDTLCMAQAALKPYQKSISLDSCLQKNGSPVAKLGTVYNMIGRTLSSLTKQELEEYGLYCTTDVEGTYWLFNFLKSRIPVKELEIIDLTLRMYLDPQFDLDADVCKNVLKDERAKKKRLVDALPPDIKKTQLSSNVQFAKLLKARGVEPPTKVSPVTHKETWAFAKNDPGWKELEDKYQNDPLIGPLLLARLGLKSTIGETRAEKFLTIAEQYGKLRVPLRYYAAHTGRYGGMEKINCQNLPRIAYGADNPNQLRHALKAPPGHTVLAGDLSQIEARLTAWLANCVDLLNVFRTGGDPYCSFASKIWGRMITKADQHERFIGKTCILGLGYGMGRFRLKDQLRASGVTEDIAMVSRYIDVYRTEYHEIRDLWNTCDGIIETMASGGNAELGPCISDSSKILLPNDMFLSYPDLSYKNYVMQDGFVHDGFWYTFSGQPRSLWGGKLVENVVQSLARIIIMDHMLEVKKRLGLYPALQAHDELVYVVPDARLAECESGLLSIMRGVPDWAAGLPVDAETGTGQTYGEAK